jgi:two-component system, cell cycle response regulator DivK
MRHIPVIAITGLAMKEDEEKIRQGGCESYLAKPFSIETFLGAIRGQLQ